VRTGVFVQVRLGSTRLPSKAMLPLPHGSVIQHVMRALRDIPADAYALLTDDASQAVLRPVAAGEGFDVRVGPEEDVLARYCMAACAYGVRRIVRATGDNPATSARLARDIMLIHDREAADLSHYLGNPWGTGVEVIEAEALFAAEREAALPDEREHITTFLYRHPDRFVIREPDAPPEASYAEGRVTVDTREDYEAVCAMFAALHRGRPLEVEDVIGWLRMREARPTAAREAPGRGATDAG
jgi:spore coat polysaccharide biosynthesis protein SpsF